MGDVRFEFICAVLAPPKRKLFFDVYFLDVDGITCYSYLEPFTVLEESQSCNAYAKMPRKESSRFEVRGPLSLLSYVSSFRPGSLRTKKKRERGPRAPERLQVQLAVLTIIGWIVQ